jgi:AcrR family transcriptional regulator
MTDKYQDETTLAEITALRNAMRPRQAPDRVEQALRRQFREHHGAEQPRHTWWQVWGVAAAVTTIVLAVLVLRPTPEAPQPTEVASREIATDYIPIGYSTPLSPNEFAQIIRVSVPRSDMAQFGLPIRLDTGPERVTADVVLGEDGVARAIRFVQ